MTRNRLEELARQMIPPPPRDIPRLVHRRLNGWLMAQHFTDLILRGLPFAMFHFLRTILAGLMFSLSGKDLDKRERDP